MLESGHMRKVLLLLALITVIGSLLFIRWAVAQYGKTTMKAGSSYGLFLPW